MDKIEMVDPRSRFREEHKKASVLRRLLVTTGMIFLLAGSKSSLLLRIFCGAEGTRTLDFLRDRRSQSLVFVSFNAFEN